MNSSQFSLAGLIPEKFSTDLYLSFLYKILYNKDRMNITQKPQDFQILFLDMNSFFASVEQQVQPFLRNLPVGVTPYPGPTGCLIAVSKEAKKLGIKTGNLVGEAKKLCPQIKILESRPALYMIYHQEISKILETFSPFWQALSIDEFLIRLSPSEQNFQKALEIAQKIKNHLKTEVGNWLTCSVGVGPNRFLAKMAAESQKPNGLVILELKNLAKFYNDLEKLTDLTGINSGLEKHLKNFRIQTPFEFYQKSLPDLARILNHWGKLWYFRLRGFEVDDWVSETKTIGHSHVLAPDLRTRKGAESVIRKLILKAGYRLRKKHFLATGVFVSIRFSDRTAFYQSKKVPAFSDFSSFIKYVFEILKLCPWKAKPILVAVSAFNLLENKKIKQDSLFKEVEKSKKISQTLDKLSDKFGANIIYPASIHSVINAAPDRIPYGQPRYDIRNE